MSEKWAEIFGERDRRLIDNCINYRNQDPAGLPGHNVMIIVANMADILHRYESWIDDVLEAHTDYTHPND